MPPQVAKFIVETDIVNDHHVQDLRARGEWPSEEKLSGLTNHYRMERRKRGAIEEPARIWPNQTIYYAFHSRIRRRGNQELMKLNSL